LKKNHFNISDRLISFLSQGFISLSTLILLSAHLNAQTTDSTVNVEGRSVTLSEVFIRSNTDIKGFIKRVRTDTSFYKAFRNLRILNYTALNDVRMMDKKGRTKATLYSRTKQDVFGNCRITKVLEENVTGDFYNGRHQYNYYTAEMYDGLFFAFDTVCGETNIVNGAMHSIKGKSGIEKHKEQLKMLFFNPGEDIPGIPLMGDKVQIFDQSHAALYDFGIDMIDRYGTTCYVFTIKAKEDIGGKKDKIVIDEMVTWFDYKTFEVLARTYRMSYGAGVYNFDVSMEVEMKRAGQYLYPALIRYIGNWGVFLKGKERGVFTATIFDVR
jgi:hypothetical protein